MRKTKKENDIRHAHQRILEAIDESGDISLEKRIQIRRIIQRLYMEAESNSIDYLGKALKELIK